MQTLQLANFDATVPQHSDSAVQLLSFFYYFCACSALRRLFSDPNGFEQGERILIVFTANATELGAFGTPRAVAAARLQHCWPAWK